MTEIFVLFGLLFVTIGFLVVKLLLKERRRRTENFEGRQIERHHSAQIRDIRAANTSIAVHNRLFDGGNDHGPRKR
ncbi:hypothetical protein ABZS83_27590 [Streptomyces sp. NPDC005426]|uniref:hypothetical protein n=1 Tax=unclassified Streptomyces TaxID=2593676 RepID=UPI00339DBD69